jgi:hypothetical protein
MTSASGVKEKHTVRARSELSSGRAQSIKWTSVGAPQVRHRDDAETGNGSAAAAATTVAMNFRLFTLSFPLGRIRLSGVPTVAFASSGASEVCSRLNAF